MKLFSLFDLPVLAVVVFSAFFPCFFKKLGEKNDNFIIFSENQKIEIPINRDTVLVVNSVEIHIKNGAAKIVESDCPNQICVAQNSLSESGQIVCVPNKVIVSLNKKSIVKEPKIDVYAH